MKGVIAAVPTPVDPEGRPLEALFLEHCAWALANGCDGLNILGSTGEANSFGSDDRKTVMRWAAEGLDTNRLMVGTGTPSLSETIALTRHAAKLGYGVALVLPPYYYTPASDAGLVAWYGALHEALAGLPIEIYFYNFPQMTGIPIPVGVIAELAKRYPQRFTGIKDSSGDLGYCRQVLQASPGLRVFPSSETSLAEAHEAGFAGCISATANLTCGLCAQVWQGDTDPQTIAEIARQRQVVASYPLMSAVKYLVGQRCGDAGWNNVLPPFLPLSPEAREALDDALSTGDA